ncbi:hypothetical protein BGZ96_009032 [Linnemannia gamsii]|uniref:Uncharacterized protein n=1 Tax=Linnemannia gamsii TaxID=64522 RepID=A0ABQ7KEM4_9FUNG|nr:hypothetical protein BGZ96_009032 [Linnemannia gamsii]
MKVAAIISLVAATALTITVQAAPAIESTFSSLPAASTTFAPPPVSTPINGGSSRNGTRPTTGSEHPPFTITNDSVLRNAIVDYDYEDAAKHIAKYYKAVYGDRPVPRTNAVSSRAATSTDILPFCVGIAFEPSRVQIFKNKMSCDANGWSTLFIFTAHTKKDVHHAKYPICVGWATKPNRSMLFSDKTTCSINEFSHDFAFYESGMKVQYDGTVNALHESTVMWQAGGPHRMMLYPYYEGDKHGWQRAYNLQYRSRYRLAPPNERGELTTQQGNHENVHKKLSIATPNTATSRCTLNLIQMWTANTVNTGNPISIAGSGNAQYKADAQRDECSNLVATSSLRVARVTVNGVSSLEAIIGGKIYAAVSIAGNTELPPAYVRVALQESLRTGRAVMVARQRDKSIQDSVVALVADTFVTIGGRQIYGTSI